LRSPVLLTSRLPSSTITRLEEACEIHWLDGEATRDALVAAIPGKQGLISMVGDPVDRAVLEAGDALTIVANVAVGFNNIDVVAARERGIVVTNTPDVLTDATADYGFALILAVMRRVVEADRLIRAGRWTSWSYDFMLGADLRGKQLGVVGYGRLGQAVARRARAFGLRIAYVPRPSSPAEADAEPMQLDRLLSTSDVVSLHVPLTPETRPPDRSEGADPHEAQRLPREHLARRGGRRGGAGVGAQAPPARRRRARRLRKRTGGPSRPADARERRPLAPHRQRRPRDAHRDGRPRRPQRHRRPAWPAAAYPRRLIR